MGMARVKRTGSQGTSPEIDIVLTLKDKMPLHYGSIRIHDSIELLPSPMLYLLFQ